MNTLKNIWQLYFVEPFWRGHEAAKRGDSLKEAIIAELQKPNPPVFPSTKEK